MKRSELTLFEAKYVTDRKQAAKRLRKLADAVAAGTFRIGGHDVKMPGEVRLKMECTTPEDRTSGEVEIEILWVPEQSGE